MKFLMFCILSLGLVLAKIDQEKFKSVRSECEVEIADHSNTKGIQRYTFCLFKKMGFQNEAGDFQEEVLRKNFGDVLSSKTVDDILKKCTVKKNTPEESAFHAIGCIAQVGGI